MAVILFKLLTGEALLPSLCQITMLHVQSKGAVWHGSHAPFAWGAAVILPLF
jgi:hypothetical protein